MIEQMYNVLMAKTLYMF